MSLRSFADDCIFAKSLRRLVRSGDGELTKFVANVSTNALSFSGSSTERNIN